MSEIIVEDCTVAEAYLRLLGARGVDLFIGNAGTDFAPIIEAFVKLEAAGVAVPRPVTAPHENVAIHVALGHWMVSGQIQTVMVHVNVGTANAICGLMNAFQGEIPVLFSSGRTPWTEHGVEGGRNLPIHWTQEMWDQGGLTRQSTKWEYELRHPAQIEGIVDRALAIAASPPRGPVYLSLPREVLAMRIERFAYSSPPRQTAAIPAFPDPAALQLAFEWLSAAASPLLITSNLGMDQDGMESLIQFADRFAVPVIQTNGRNVSLPSAHPMHAGYDPASLLGKADLILVVESPVPWIPDRVRPAADARVVSFGADPLHQRLPVRSFESDLTIAGRGSAALRALTGFATQRNAGQYEQAFAHRREAITARKAARLEALRIRSEEARVRSPISPDYIAECISAVCGPDSILLRESPRISPESFNLTHRLGYLSAGAAGGLGWGLGAAVGAALAAPERLVVVIVGDGSYMFGVPVAAHYVALEQNAPFLTVIANNQRWNEVRSATRHLYPAGAAATANAREPLTYFDKALELHRTVEVAGGYGERVEDPALLPDALRRAVRMVMQERRQVVLDVICGD